MSVFGGVTYNIPVRPIHRQIWCMRKSYIHVHVVYICSVYSYTLVLYNKIIIVVHMHEVFKCMFMSNMCMDTGFAVLSRMRKIARCTIVVCG